MRPFPCNSIVGFQNPSLHQTSKHSFACWRSAAALVLEIVGGLRGSAGGAHTGLTQPTLSSSAGTLAKAEPEPSGPQPSWAVHHVQGKLWSLSLQPRVTCV